MTKNRLKQLILDFYISQHNIVFDNNTFILYDATEMTH